MTACTPQNILVVDDEPLVCDTVKMLLKRDGHSVTTVRSGGEALAVFEPGKFDLVITDLSMPAMTGLELAIAMKTTAPRQNVVLLTAYAERFRSQPPLPAIDFLIEKPLSLQGLRDAVNRFAPAKNVESVPSQS